MNAISVCDGISAASQACEGLDYNFLLLAEIEAFPRSVLKHRHHAVDQRRYLPRHSAAGRPALWGDFTAIRPRHIRRLHGHADVDVLFGGTPCQSFSIAGKRAGLDSPNGDLSLEYALLAYRLGVRWFFWENVHGVFSSAGGEDFAAILSAFTGRVVEVPKNGWQSSGVIPEASAGHFGIAWRVFDAQYAGVPQRRRRVFVVGHLGDWRRAAAVLFERYSMQGHPAPRREAGKDVAPTISARPSGGGGLGTDFDLDGGLIQSAWPADIAPTLNAHFGDKLGLEDQHIRGGQVYSSTGDTAHCLNAGGMGRQDFETETLLAVGGFPDLPATHTLRGEGFDASEDGTGRGTPLVPVTCSALTTKPYADHEAQEDKLIPVAYRTAGDGAVYTEGDRTAPLTTATDPNANIVTQAIGWSEELTASVELAGTVQRGGEGGRHEGVMTPAMAVRRLTPRECERLQGFPDDYTLVSHRSKDAADGPRYKALGNSWAVPCARWIAERILEVDSL